MMGSVWKAAVAAAMVVWGADQAAAGSRGDAACEQYFAKTGSQSLIEAAVGTRKRGGIVVVPPEQQYVDVQVGCVAAPGNGNVGDSLTVKANDGETLVPEILSTGEPGGRCDPGPLGQMSAVTNDRRTVAIKLETLCNYRGVGTYAKGPCTKCYQVRVRFQQDTQQ